MTTVADLTFIELRERYLNDAPANLAAYAKSAMHYQISARARATWKSYGCLWNLIRNFCKSVGELPLPMSVPTARAFFAWMGDNEYSASYIRQARAVINLSHRWFRETSPLNDVAVLDTYRGACRVRLIEKPPKGKSALSPDELKAAIAGLSDPQKQTALVLGVASASRRSELSAMDIVDIEIEKAGMWITYPKSKTDQEHFGQRVWVGRGSNCCPVRLVEKWIEMLREEALKRKPELRATPDLLELSGPLFRHRTKKEISERRLSSRTICRWVKEAAERVNLDPDDFGAHSLRAGGATAAISSGAPDTQTLALTRHASVDGLLPYFRPRGSQVPNLTQAMGL